MSIEEKIKEIEKEYLDLHNMCVRLDDTYTRYPTSRKAKISEVNDAIKATLKLQNDVELLWEETYKIGQDQKLKYYTDRLKDNIDRLRYLIRGTQLEKSYYNGAVDYLSNKNFELALSRIARIRNRIYQIFTDIRILYSLKIYPIEEKLALKSKLIDLNFNDVVKCLDEIDDNIANEHYKDAIDRSRESLEKTITNILNKLGKTPSNRFSTDIGTLSGKKLMFIDKETKLLTTATYSYLSEVGAHGRTGEVTQSDSYYTVKEVYMRIDKLINILDNYTKEK